MCLEFCGQAVRQGVGLWQEEGALPEVAGHQGRQGKGQRVRGRRDVQLHDPKHHAPHPGRPGRLLLRNDRAEQRAQRAVRDQGGDALGRRLVKDLGGQPLPARGCQSGLHALQLVEITPASMIGSMSLVTRIPQAPYFSAGSLASRMSGTVAAMRSSCSPGWPFPCARSGRMARRSGLGRRPSASRSFIALASLGLPSYMFQWEILDAYAVSVIARVLRVHPFHALTRHARRTLRIRFTSRSRRLLLGRFGCAQSRCA